MSALHWLTTARGLFVLFVVALVSWAAFRSVRAAIAELEGGLGLREAPAAWYVVGSLLAATWRLSGFALLLALAWRLAVAVGA